MNVFPSEVVLNQCNDSRKDQSASGQAWESMRLREASQLCHDWDCTIWKHEGRIVNAMGSGNRKLSVDFEGVKDEVRESAVGENFQQKLVVGEKKSNEYFIGLKITAVVLHHAQGMVVLTLPCASP